MLFCCTIIPFGLIIATCFVADAIRHREQQHHYWSASLLFGSLGSITSLSYTRCGWGQEFLIDLPARIVPTIYRGWPFAWWGWIGLDVILAPSAYFFIDWIVWTILAVLLSYLIPLAQRYVHYETREMAQIGTVGVLIAVAPVLLALLIGGRGC
jgi:hypothetical protein